MTIERLTLQEMDLVHGGNAGKILGGCFTGAVMGHSAASAGHKWQGAGAGCLAGASVALLGGGPNLQSAAGLFAGAGFGPYRGTSNNKTAGNYENSFDQMDTLARLTSV